MTFFSSCIIRNQLTSCVGGIKTSTNSAVNLQHEQRNTRMADKRGKDRKPNKGSSVKGSKKRKAKQAKSTFNIVKKKKPTQIIICSLPNWQYWYHSLCAADWSLFSSVINLATNAYLKSMMCSGSAVAELMRCHIHGLYVAPLTHCSSVNLYGNKKVLFSGTWW